MIARWMAAMAVLAGLPAVAETAPRVVFPEVTDVAHAELIRGWDDAAFERGQSLYQKVCFACHGVDGKAATVQGARAFAVDPLTHQADPYSLFKTVTFGYGAMPQQQWMTPAQRYDVVHYIREAFLRKSNPSQYVKVDDGYALDTLPIPAENPYGAWLRTSALGFFEDGRCVVATYTGDIWIVSGIDEGLRHVTWQRFATGLYEPFGVIVIDGLVHLSAPFPQHSHQS